MRDDNGKGSFVNKKAFGFDRIKIKHIPTSANGKIYVDNPLHSIVAANYLSSEWKEQSPLWSVAGLRFHEDQNQVEVTASNQVIEGYIKNEKHNSEAQAKAKLGAAVYMHYREKMQRQVEKRFANQVKYLESRMLVNETLKESRKRKSPQLDQGEPMSSVSGDQTTNDELLEECKWSKNSISTIVGEIKAIVLQNAGYELVRNAKNLRVGILYHCARYRDEHPDFQAISLSHCLTNPEASIMIERYSKSQKFLANTAWNAMYFGRSNNKGRGNMMVMCQAYLDHIRSESLPSSMEVANV